MDPQNRSPQAASARASPLDLALLAEAWGDDAAGIAEALQFFRRTSEDDARVLRQAVAEHDPVLAGHASHRMLGSARVVGAHALEAVCARIQRSSVAGDWADAAAALQELSTEWQRLSDHIDALAAAGGPVRSERRKQ